MHINLSHWFKPQVLEEADSSFSDRIKVIKSGRSIHLSTGRLTQSGGLVADVWRPVIKSLLKSYHPKPKNCLILGLAGGTVAGIIAKTFPGIRMVGVEIDPVMLSLGKKYLGLGDIPNLKIVRADAHSYILNLKSYFDIILVDLYLADQIPSFVHTNKFLGQLGQLGQLVILNHLFYDPPKRLAAEKLVKKLEKIFPSVQLHRVLTNLMIICQ